MTTNRDLVVSSLKCLCPQCGKDNIFPHRLTLTVKDQCTACGLDLKNHDSGDGPAFFLLSVLCIVITPLALWFAAVTDLPLWLYAIIWTLVCLAACIVTLQPLKTYFITLNFKHRDGAHGV
jgi:uncharacterized protein (DUF983 family)